MVRPVPAGRRGSCCTPYSRLQEEIDNVETIAVTANNTANNASQLAQQALTRDTFDDVNVNGDLNVYGDIIQQGAAYETHAQHVFSTDDYIVMRDGALVGLAVGDYSGFQVKKYDGTNDGRLVIDRDGTARVGDVGDEQPLLTRDESADMVDAAPLVWDTANSKAVSGAFPVPDPGVASINGISPDADNDFTIEAGTGVTITAGTNKITIAAAGGGSWNKRTADNDWSDLFEVTGTTMTAKKDIYIQKSNYDVGLTVINVYIPKGMTGESDDFTFPIYMYNTSTTDGRIRVSPFLKIKTSDISSSVTALVVFYTTYQFTTDGSTISVSINNTNNISFQKRFLNVYTKD